LVDIGLSSQTTGHITICNQSRAHFKDATGQVLRLDRNSLQESWCSPTRQEIRASMLSGEQHANCRDCWDEELAGRLSMRQMVNKKFANVTVDVDQPRAFMLKPGNACNLSCRHCHPSISSKWYRDHYQASIKPKSDISFVDYIRTYDSIRDSFAADSTNFWPALQQWNKNIIYYDLYGGEPLLNSPLLDLLRQSYLTGVSKNQQIHINTNGTIWHDDFNEVFGSFQKVDVGISIDGIQEKFEYMRHPAKWNLLLENLKKYQELSLKCSGIELTVCITVSLLNVYYLPEFVNFFHQLGITCGINIVHRPDYLNMRIAPSAVKQKIIDKLENSQYILKEFKEHISSTINFLSLGHNNSQQLMQEFWEFTNKYDSLRKESYADVFPEFYEILTNE
jgi:sulfatase maturation enzyme AslB (radical SAM superfamily)